MRSRPRVSSLLSGHWSGWTGLRVLCYTLGARDPWRSRSGPTRHDPQLLQARVSRRRRPCAAFDRGLGAQGLFDPIEMAATMHRTPQDARLPTHLNLRHDLRWQLLQGLIDRLRGVEG
jgi:hypothetical protein